MKGLNKERKLKLMKKGVVCVLVFTLASTLFVGCKNDTEKITEESEKGSTGIEVINGDSQLEPLKLSIMYKDKQDSPFNPDWAVIKEIEEKGNVELEFRIVPEQQYSQKIQIGFNTGDVPDIVTFVYPETVQAFAKSDLLVPISDYMEQMPNYKAYIELHGLAKDVDSKTLNDGKAYWVQGFKDISEYNSGILIRKDLFDKHELGMPETVEDLNVALFTLKELYPDTYPMTGYNSMDMMLALTSTYFGTMAGWISPDATGYDTDTEKWVSSYISDEGKALVEYYSGLYENDILDPELFTQNFEQWIQRLTTEQSFVSVGFAPTLSLINSTAKSLGNDSFEMVLLPPLSSEIEPVSKVVLPRNNSSWVVPLSVTKRDDFDRIIDFIDWYLYSEEGIILQNWGIEGTTFEVVDDKKQYLMTMNEAKIGYGVATDSLSIVQDIESIEAKMDPIVYEMTKDIYDANRNFEAIKMQDYDDDTMEEVMILSATLKDLSSRYYQQFIMGELDIQEDWDKFIIDSESAGASKLIELKNSELNN